MRDGAAGVNVDVSELFSDVFTGDNDTVIRFEAEILPAKSSLYFKSGQSTCHWRTHLW